MQLYFCISLLAAIAFAAISLLQILISTTLFHIVSPPLFLSPTVAQFGYVGRGATSTILCGFIPLCSRTVCHLVVVCAHWTGSGRSETRSNRMAFLDETCRGHSWFDWRRCLHVHSVSSIFAFVSSLACTKSVNIKLAHDYDLLWSFHFHYFYLCHLQHFIDSKRTGKDSSAAIAGASSSSSQSSPHQQYVFRPSDQCIGIKQFQSIGARSNRCQHREQSIELRTRLDARRFESIIIQTMSAGLGQFDAITISRFRTHYVRPGPSEEFRPFVDTRFRSRSQSNAQCNAFDWHGRCESFNSRSHCRRRCAIVNRCQSARHESVQSECCIACQRPFSKFVGIFGKQWHTRWQRLSKAVPSPFDNNHRSRCTQWD